jgi:hypothetical protein
MDFAAAWRAGSVFAVVLTAAVALGAVQFVLVRRLVVSEAFEAQAEERLGRLLRARVDIGRIRFRFPASARLQNIAVRPLDSAADFRFTVQEISFRYTLNQLIQRRLSHPSAIFFKQPSFLTETRGPDFSGVPDDPFRAVSLISRFGVAGGTARFPLSFPEGWIELKDVRGGVRPDAGVALKVDIKAGVDGFVKGRVALTGQIWPSLKKYRLSLDMDSISVPGWKACPWRNLRGRLTAEDGQIRIESLEIPNGGWLTLISGGVRRLTQNPVIDLTIALKKAEPLAAGRLTVDLGAKRLKGSVRLAAGGESGFEGKVERQGAALLFEELAVKGLTGGGRMDFSTGAYEFAFEGPKRRFGLRSDLNASAFQLTFEADHFDFWGLDLVARGTARFQPVSTWDDQPWRFQGKFTTDYFVLEYEPFENFKGHFTLVSPGRLSFGGGWGRVFETGGEVDLSRPSAVGEAWLRVRGFDLAKVHDFARRPLPKALKGTLQGKLKIRGHFDRPEVIGNFRVKKGMIGKMDYDRAIIQFRGFAPYLPLRDSKVLRGRSAFTLAGALDLSLDNVFHGMRIETTEKLVIWKGVSAFARSGEGGLEIDAPAGLPDLNLGVSSGSNHESDRADGEQQVSAVVGPKIQF